jgi:hypothetical protein
MDSGRGLGWDSRTAAMNGSLTREVDLGWRIVASTPRTIAKQEVYPIPPSVFTIIVRFFSLILGADLRTNLTLDVGEDD